MSVSLVPEVFPGFGESSTSAESKQDDVTHVRLWDWLDVTSMTPHQQFLKYLSASRPTRNTDVRFGDLGHELMLRHLADPARPHMPVGLEAEKCGLGTRSFHRCRSSFAAAGLLGSHAFANSVLSHLLADVFAKRLELVCTLVSTSYDETALHLRVSEGKLLPNLPPESRTGRKSAKSCAKILQTGRTHLHCHQGAGLR